MKSQAAKVLVMLFAALAVQCAFDGPGTEASTPSQPPEDSAFCAVLDAGSVEITLPTGPVPRASAGEAIGPLPGVYPLWSLAQSIDHPPEQPV